MTTQAEVFDTYEKIVDSATLIGKTKPLFQKALDKAGKLRFVMLAEEELGKLGEEIAKINGESDMNAGHISNKIFGIRFLKGIYNAKGDGKLSRKELGILKNYTRDVVRIMDDLLDYCAEFCELQVETAGHVSKTRVNKFVGLGFKKIIGNKNFHTRARLNDLWDVVRFIHGKFKKEYSRETQELVRLLSKGEFEEAGKKAGRISDFLELPKPFSVAGFGHPKDLLENPETNFDFLISFYAIVDGSGFRHPKEWADTRLLEKEGKVVAGLRQFSQHIMSKCSGPPFDKDELVRLGKALHGRGEIVFDLFSESRVSKGKEFVDNWIDLLSKKLGRGFSVEEVVSIEKIAHVTSGKAVKGNLVKARSLKEAYEGLQHYFRQMYEIVMENQEAIGRVESAWDESIKNINEIAGMANSSIETLESSWKKIREDVKSAVRRYPEMSVKEVIKAELYFEHRIQSEFYRFINQWVGSEKSVFNKYLHKLVPGQNEVFILTVPDWNELREEKDAITKISESYAAEMDSCLKSSEHLIKNFGGLFA